MPTSVARVGGNLPAGNFIPAVWSKKLQAKFYANTVLDQIANHDWEGEIKGKGSKVEIRARPTIVIQDYTVNGNLSYQDLADDMIELLIDKAKAFAFKVDDIDKAQADINAINESTQDAAEQMKITVDTQVLGTVYASAGLSVVSTQVTKATVLDWIVDISVKMDESNVPTSGRWIVLPPWIAGMIRKSDLHKANEMGDGTSILRKDQLGSFSGLMIYTSNLLAFTGGTTYQTLAGTKAGICFASQFVKTETLRLQNTFGDAVRGLNVYGFKVTKPEALLVAPATK